MAHSDPSSRELDDLLGRLRAEPSPAVVDQVAAGLPSRVAARLRVRRPDVVPAYPRWALGLAPLTAVCVALAWMRMEELGAAALTDPQWAGWLFSFLG